MNNLRYDARTEIFVVYKEFCHLQSLGFILELTMSLQKSIQKVYLKVAIFLPVIACIVGLPIIVLSRLIHPLGVLYYWFIFAISDYLCVSETDDEVRRELLKSLHSSITPHTKILEIGAGTGRNFPFYPEGTTLSTLDVNPLLERHAHRMKGNYPSLKIDQRFIANAEDMTHIIQDNSFDAIVGTHILCCIRDPSAAVREIYRILKPVSASL
jgi:hypothetical protein